MKSDQGLADDEKRRFIEEKRIDLAGPENYSIDAYLELLEKSEPSKKPKILIIDPQKELEDKYKKGFSRFGYNNDVTINTDVVTYKQLKELKIDSYDIVIVNYELKNAKKRFFVKTLTEIYNELPNISTLIKTLSPNHMFSGFSRKKSRKNELVRERIDIQKDLERKIKTMSELIKEDLRSDLNDMNTDKAFSVMCDLYNALSSYSKLLRTKEHFENGENEVKKNLLEKLTILLHEKRELCQADNFNGINIVQECKKSRVPSVLITDYFMNETTIMKKLDNMNDFVKSIFRASKMPLFSKNAASDFVTHNILFFEGKTDYAEPQLLDSEKAKELSAILLDLARSPGWAESRMIVGAKTGIIGSVFDPKKLYSDKSRLYIMKLDETIEKVVSNVLASAVARDETVNINMVEYLGVPIIKKNKNEYEYLAIKINGVDAYISPSVFAVGYYLYELIDNAKDWLNTLKTEKRQEENPSGLSNYSKLKEFYRILFETYNRYNVVWQKFSHHEKDVRTICKEIDLSSRLKRYAKTKENLSAVLEYYKTFTRNAIISLNEGNCNVQDVDEGMSLLNKIVDENTVTREFDNQFRNGCLQSNTSVCSLENITSLLSNASNTDDIAEIIKKRIIRWDPNSRPGHILFSLYLTASNKYAEKLRELNENILTKNPIQLAEDHLRNVGLEASTHVHDIYLMAYVADLIYADLIHTKHIPHAEVLYRAKLIDTNAYKKHLLDACESFQYYLKQVQPRHDEYVNVLETQKEGSVIPVFEKLVKTIQSGLTNACEKSKRKLDNLE